MENAKFKRPVGPGDIIQMQVNIKETFNGVWFLKGILRVKEKVAVKNIFSIPSYIIPIRPQFHRLLFPEVEKQLELQPGNRPFGKSIRKSDLANALIRTIKPGSNIFFYRSVDWNSVMLVGIVEDTLVSSSPIFQRAWKTGSIQALECIEPFHWL